MKKRILALLLALTLSGSLLIFSASTVEIVDSGTCGTDGDNLTWTLDHNGVLTISGVGEMSDNSWEMFSGNEQIVSVIIESGVTGIGDSAFSSCSNLEEVSIPNTVSSVGRGAFFGTGLKEAVLPDSVTSVGSAVFTNCKNLERLVLSDNIEVIPSSFVQACSGLREVNIPEKAVQIDTLAFAECASLTEITIPGSVQSFGHSVFWNCSSLQTIHVNRNSPYYCSVDGVLFTADRSTLVCYPTGRAGGYQIPEGTQCIGEDAFLSCTVLTEVQIPSTLKTIEFTAFAECSGLTDLTIPDNVIEIGRYAFRDCSGLKTVSLPADMNEIPDGIFSNCSRLKNIRIPERVKAIRYWSFAYCTALESLVIPDGVAAIGEMALYQCESLQTVVIPESVTEIGGHAFNGCSGLQQIDLPSGLKIISSEMLEGCSGLTKIVIPDGVTEIQNAAFASCTGITDIIIPDGVTSLGAAAFEQCTNLNRVTIPSSVSKIEWYAFSGCSSLTDVYYDGTAEQWASIVIDRYNEPLKNADVHLMIKALTITSQPQDCTSKLNSIASFSVSAEGKGLSYQWQYRTPGGSWKNCTAKTAGYNTNALSVEAAQSRSGYQYRCVVKDQNGNSVTSGAAVLNVVEPVAIVCSPADSYAVESRVSSFYVDAEGTGLTYQWQWRKPGGSWTNSTSATVGYNTAILIVHGASNGTNRNGYQYRCVVTDAYGNEAVSEIAKLTVFAIKTQPKSAKTTAGGTAAFTVNATGAGLSYQWQYKTTGEWRNCTASTEGYNTDTLRVQGVTGSRNRNGYQYRCIVTDALGNTLTTGAATLTVG